MIDSGKVKSKRDTPFSVAGIGITLPTLGHSQRI